MLGPEEREELRALKESLESLHRKVNKIMSVTLTLAQAFQQLLSDEAAEEVAIQNAVTEMEAAVQIIAAEAAAGAGLTPLQVQQLDQRLTAATASLVQGASDLGAAENPPAPAPSPAPAPAPDPTPSPAPSPAPDAPASS